MAVRANNFTSLRCLTQLKWPIDLGIAQDAGYPQAGCFAEHCLPGWDGKKPRQRAVSIGVFDSGSGKCLLFEATPNFPEQLYAFTQATPSTQPGIDAIFLTHAHIGHYAGLMYFGREAMGSRDTPVYAMPRMAAYLTANGPWSQLVALDNIAPRPMAEAQTIHLGAVAVTPLRVPHRDEFSETVGFIIEGPNKRALFVPDIDKWDRWDSELQHMLRSVDYAFLDATFYADGELAGRDMSTIPHLFITETMALLANMEPEQRAKVWFIHMNHTNPALWDDSPATNAIRSAGFNVAPRGHGARSLASEQFCEITVAPRRT